MALDPSSFRVEIVTSESVLDQIAALRVTAWRAHGAEIPSFIEHQDIHNDAHERHATHFAIMRDGHPIAASKMCIHSRPDECPDPESLWGYEEKLLAPIATLNRLVVHPDFRGMGLPSLLIQSRLALASEKKCASIVSVIEQPSRMREMEELGFVRLGPTRVRYFSSLESFAYMIRL